MIDIFLKAEQCKLALTGDPVAIAEGSKNYVRLNFDLCPDWQQMQTICANFRHHYGEQIISIPVSDNKCLVPHEILKKPELHVSLFGTTGTEENAVHMTTGILYVPVLPSEIGESGEPEPDSPDIFDAILSSVAGINQAVDESAASAAEAEEQATAAATSAATSEHYASEAAQSAQDSADSAESSASSASAAQSAATAAQTAAENAETSASNAATSAGNAETAASEAADSASEAATSAANAQQIAQSVRDDADAGEFKGDKGDKGDPGEGIPEGGTAGQVLTKTADGTAWEDASDPVTYPIPVNKGGSGKTTAKAAQNAFLADMNSASNAITDSNEIVFAYDSPSDTTGAVYKRTLSNLWTWIYNKIKTVVSPSDIGAVEKIPGIIHAYAGQTAPEGYLLCDGSKVSRTTYAALYAVIGDWFGDGDGSTTFTLPDFRTRVPVGADDRETMFKFSYKGGSKDHQLTVDEIPSHRHKVIYWRSNWSETDDVVDGSTYNSCEFANYTDNKIRAVFAHDAAKDATKTGGDQAHNNMQPYLVVNYIISTGL